MWFFLALVSAFALASADAYTKKWFAGTSGLDLIVVRFALPALLLAPVLSVVPFSTLDLHFWLLIMLLVPLEIAAMYLYVKAVRDAPLHLTLPFLSFTPVFNILTGWLFLGERVSLAGMGGILLIVAGAYVINVRPGHSYRPAQILQPFIAIKDTRQSVMMLAAAAIYSLTSTLSKQALAYMPPAVFGAFYFVVIGAGTVALMFVLRPAALGVLKRAFAPSVLVALMMSAMVVAHFLSIARIEVAYMIAVKRTSLLFGLVYGYLLFHDSRFRNNISAGLLMLAGVCIIVLA